MGYNSLFQTVQTRPVHYNKCQMRPLLLNAQIFLSSHRCSPTLAPRSSLFYCYLCAFVLFPVKMSNQCGAITVPPNH